MYKLFFNFLLLFVSSSYAQTFEELTTSALKATNENKFREAINLYNQALELDNNNHFIFNKISLMYYSLDNFDSSIVYCNLTLKFVPNDTTALFQRGHSYMEKEMYQEALNDFLRSFEYSNKRNVHCAFNVGKAYSNIGNLEKAIEYYKITLTLDPNDKYASYELGYCYASLPKPDKENALKYYDKAIEQDNNYYDAYFNRGLLHAVQFKNYQKGHQDLEKSINIRPKNKLSYLYNGMLYRDEEKFDKANEMFNKVLELYPDYAKAYYERAITWYHIGVLNMVCKDLEKALELGYRKAKDAIKELCK